MIKKLTIDQLLKESAEKYSNNISEGDFSFFSLSIEEKVKPVALIPCDSAYLFNIICSGDSVNKFLSLKSMIFGRDWLFFGWLPLESGRGGSCRLLFCRWDKPGSRICQFGVELRKPQLQCQARMRSYHQWKGRFQQLVGLDKFQFEQTLCPCQFQL